MVAAVREEAVAFARRADVEAVDVLAAGRAQRALGRGPEVELAVTHDVLAEGLAERLRDLVADLVAARPDARPDRRAQAPPAERAHADADEPREEAAPARVEDLDGRLLALRARHRDRHAVRG